MTGIDAIAALPRGRLLAEFSLWSADLARLEADLARTQPYADIYHLDVADGRFAPSFLFFPDLTARVRALTGTPLHVHLMVEADILEEQVRQFADAGADLISVHAEVLGACPGVLGLIRGLGCAAGIVLRLRTGVGAAAPWLDHAAVLTLLGTEIGVKGQSLSPLAPARLREARALADAHGVLLAADGGIRETTVPALRASGADTVVLGSLAFGAADLAARIAWLRTLG
jgi:ribulose-phosphate 3-epimerase